MTQEALKLALDALENHTAIKHPQQIHYRDKAITAIKEALAQLEQAQRPWVGLTDDEIAQGCKESWVTEQAWQSAVWWAEDKLKQKNHVAQETNS